MDAPMSYSDTELANMTTAHDQDIFNGLKQSVSNYDFSIFHSKISCIYSNNAIFNSDPELAQLNKIQGHILRYIAMLM